MTPTLLEAAKAVRRMLSEWSTNSNTSAAPSGTVVSHENLKWLSEKIGAAIEEEERKPKVERKVFWTPGFEWVERIMGQVCRERTDAGWTVVFERPLPVKTKAEELADRLAARCRKDGQDPETCPCDDARAAAELRRKG